MLIRSLETMEEIVKSNKSLVWDGWTVVSLKPAVGKTNSSNVVKIRNRWYIQQRFEVSENGWNIPDKLLESNG
jgi:hypothetical protein